MAAMALRVCVGAVPGQGGGEWVPAKKGMVVRMAKMWGAAAVLVVEAGVLAWLVGAQVWEWVRAGLSAGIGY